jgi:hypothetical protein
MMASPKLGTPRKGSPKKSGPSATRVSKPAAPITLKELKEAGIDETEALIEWRIMNAKQLDAAVKLLGPKSRDDVETALIEIQFEYNQLIGGFAPNKFAKKAVKKFLPGLRRVERLMRNEALPFEISFFDANAVAEILGRCETIVAAAPADNPRKGAEYKRLVVRKAVALMGTHNAPHSHLVKLASVLYGDPNVSLTSQCAAILREARKR